MIEGKRDTYFTVEEFAAMIKRSPRTIQNWISLRRLRPRYLFGIPMIPLSAIENIIAEDAPPHAKEGRLAMRLMGDR